MLIKSSKGMRTLLLTGATSGLGYELVKKCIPLFDRFILTGRNQEKLQQVRSELLKLDGTCEVVLFTVDFSDELGVLNTAKKIQATFPEIDVWINNIGALHSRHELSGLMLEKTIAVNYLSHFILMSPFLNSLRPGTQIINIVSSAYKNGKFDFLRRKKNLYSIRQAYADSKLALMTYSKYLHDNYPLLVNCFHPGRLHTDIGGKHTGLLHKTYWNLTKMIAGSAEEYASFLMNFIQENFEKQEDGYYWDVYKKVSLEEIQYPENSEELLKWSQMQLDKLQSIRI